MDLGVSKADFGSVAGWWLAVRLGRVGLVGLVGLVGRIGLLGLIGHILRIDRLGSRCSVDRQACSCTAWVDVNTVY